MTFTAKDLPSQGSCAAIHYREKPSSGTVRGLGAEIGVLVSRNGPYKRWVSASPSRKAARPVP
jgi:hypothetical protein